MTIHNNRIKVLITRPEKKAQALAKSLAQLHINAINQPLFDYQPLADNEASQRLLTTSKIIIFVSASAVEFAHQQFAAKQWRYEKIIAVGRATKKALQHIGIDGIISPEQENSEGLLALTALNKTFINEAITIVRGNSGREHLAKQLAKQGAQVTYLESYQCLWRTFNENKAQQWFTQQINCIVVTSNAILEKLMLLLSLNLQETRDNHSLTAYWRSQCLWVVVSQRIANTAKQFGLSQVIISRGASEDAILNTLKRLNNDGKTSTPHDNL